MTKPNVDPTSIYRLMRECRIELTYSMLAAGKIAQLAIGDPSIRSTTVTYSTSPVLMQHDRMSELHPFGCKVTYFVEETHRRKFDATARVGILLGYRDGGYEIVAAE